MYQKGKSLKVPPGQGSIEKTAMVTDMQLAERLERVNLVLHTIRAVDQVILEETDCDRLIKGVCHSLVATLGYYNAWIVLLDENGKFLTAAEDGLDGAFQPLVEKIRKEGFSQCGRQALTQAEALIISDPALTCMDCPLSPGYRGRGGITARLYHQGNLYGLLCASIPASLVEEKEERSLFEEIAGDVAFALHKMKLEEERKQAEGALQRSENRYRALFDNASEAILVRNLFGNIMMANNAMAELTGYTVQELIGMNISQFLTADSFKIALKEQISQKKSSPQRYELQMVRKDRTERTIEVVTSLVEKREAPVIQAIARDITAQKRAQKNLRAYASAAIVAQEEERKRIARELHDETAQALASLGMDIGFLAKAKIQSPRDVSRSLEDLQKKTESILAGVRALSKALRPPMLEEFGLLSALEELLGELNQQPSMRIRFAVKGIPRRLTPDAEIAFYRIAQEAIANIKKHADATRSVLLLTYTSTMLKLRISDNGKGFVSPESTSDLTCSGKLGLAGMQERARLIGGKLTIKSHPNKGTLVLLELPLEEVIIGHESCESA
jgi:two-component system sensor histidine kinase DegS